MSGAIDEKVDSSNTTLKKKRNKQHQMYKGKFPVHDSNIEIKDRPDFEEHHEDESENNKRFHLGKSFVDRIEDKIAQLTTSSTVSLPSLNTIEKKFAGRNRIYIGSIDDEITEEDITNLFKPYGEYAELFINKTKHFAFLKMDYYCNAQRAQKELNGVVVKNKSLKLKFSPSCASVKVKNLSQYVTNELLHYAFSVFGEIENAVVLVDDKGRSTCEGIIDFARKNSALYAIQKCKEKCYFLTNSLKPAVVENYDIIDQSVGLLDKHFHSKNMDFMQERSVGPKLAELGSFEHEYGTRWKTLYDLHRQKEEALRVELRLECEKLAAQMAYARFEYETEALREKLRARELDKERQKREWEAKKRQVEEERLRSEERIRQTQESLQYRLVRQHEDVRRRREEETTLLLHAQNLSCILDNQEQNIEYDVPTSSTRDMSGGYMSDRDSINSSKNGLLMPLPSTNNLESHWNYVGNEGRWVREDITENVYDNSSKKRRY